VTEASVSLRTERVGDALISVQALTKHFHTRRLLGRKAVKVSAVDGVTFSLREGETLGLVGESGCGKSTLARVLTGLLAPTSGSVFLRGEDVHARGSRRLLRGELQMVFQDPAGSLDPRCRIADSVAEPLRVRGGSATRRAAAIEILQRVNLEPELGDRYPHQISGGQQQRACIARALIADPSVIVLDEAVSSLDVSLQAQIVTLLLDLQTEFRASYIFITHDLATAVEVSTQIAIMYLGEIVEMIPAAMFEKGTLHPYSHALVDAVPVPDPRVQRHRKQVQLRGDIPSAVDPPHGCRFHTRCPYAQLSCETDKPPLVEHRPGHLAACHFVGEIELSRSLLSLASPGSNLA
jgi:oligopeptide transport system ATP-binding protein